MVTRKNYGDWKNKRKIEFLYKIINRETKNALLPYQQKYSGFFF